jgi:hypothetical protein
MKPKFPNSEQSPTLPPQKAELEQLFQGNVLLTRDQIDEIHELEMSSQDTPPIRAVKPNEEHNTTVTLFDSETIEDILADEERVRKSFVRSKKPSAWWYGVQNSLRYNSVEEIDEIQIAAKHTADIEVNGTKEPDQYFEIYEIGEQKADKDSLNTVFETLRLIDQFSGGLLAADPKRPKVILGNDIRLKRNNGGDELKGFATDSFVFINMTGIAESANQVNADYQEILAATVIHEILGHSLEILTTKSGAYFKEHFDYSEDKTAGEHFDSIHASITAKDASKSDSKPVREYGALNSAEDLATTVDATVSEALGFGKSTSKVTKFASKPDEYRKQLAIELMNRAADQAKEYKNTPGFVGSEINYTANDNGELKVNPVRELKISSVSGEAAVQDEISKIISKSKFPPELIVKAEIFTGI